MIDLNSAACTEFGVALLKGEATHFLVPVTPSVKATLKQMLQATLGYLGDSTNWADYDCADQYPTTGQLKYKLNDPVLVKLQNLFTAQNLPPAVAALKQPANINYYFARFRDKDEVECMGVRKASQFKGPVGKSFMTWIDGQLTMVQGELFRLDTDFDFIISADQVAIYRPRSFEGIADLDEEMKKVTPQHIQTLETALPILDFGFATEKADKYVRVRKLIAAIGRRTDLSAISVEKLKSECHKHGIKVIETNGKWHPEPDHEIGLLEMLDRRRYNDPLIEVEPDSYRAASRNKMQK